VPHDRDVSSALLAYRQGHPGAFDRLVALVYDDLRRIARRQLGQLRSGQTLNTTGLVHEAYLKMAPASGADWQSRAHFFAVAARAMRQILVDHARSRRRRKRGGNRMAIPLEEDVGAVGADAERLLHVHEALDRLEALDARLAQIVECRFFAGYSEEETAEIVGASTRTVRREWQRARAWLHELMRPSSPSRHPASGDGPEGEV
jgi:RNA polymerase sigma factor (TIGR02999 family)